MRLVFPDVFDENFNSHLSHRCYSVAQTVVSTVINDTKELFHS